MVATIIIFIVGPSRISKIGASRSATCAYFRYLAQWLPSGSRYREHYCGYHDYAYDRRRGEALQLQERESGERPRLFWWLAGLGEMSD